MRLKDTNEKIRDLREERNQTQAQIASVLQITQQTYSKYEIGDSELPVHHLKRLARYYQVSSDYLLGLSSHKSISSDLDAPFIKNMTVGEFLDLVIRLEPPIRRTLVDLSIHLSKAKQTD